MKQNIWDKKKTKKHPQKNLQQHFLKKNWIMDDHEIWPKNPSDAAPAFEGSWALTSFPSSDKFHLQADLHQAE